MGGGCVRRHVCPFELATEHGDGVPTSEVGGPNPSRRSEVGSPMAESDFRVGGLDGH
jgi:hypothetical protein